MSADAEVSSVTVTLDLRHLRCPMPVLRTRKTLATLKPGSILIVECTDPLATLDIPHLLTESGDTLMQLDVRNGMQIFTIKKR